MTPSEHYVANLCQNSFLPFSSFPNPIGKKNKELCGVLVVCGDFVLIISVKDITVSDSSDKTIQYERWIKKAVHDSANQSMGLSGSLKFG